VLFAIGSLLTGLYLGYQGLASAYGAAASLVVLLVWMYYSAQIILFGAEFTRVYMQARGRRVSGGPDLAAPTSAEAALE